MFTRVFKGANARWWLFSSVVVISLLCIALISLAGWKAYKRYKIASRLAVMNDIADQIIVASTYEALERGIAATALGSAGYADSNVLKRIQKLRMKGDAEFEVAISAAHDIADKEPGSHFATELDQTIHTYKMLAELRERVDSSLKAGVMDVQLTLEWFAAMTDVIDQAARLRRAAFATADPLYQISQDNLILKQSVWLISEYMGRERGTLGPIIAARRPIPPEVLQNLSTSHEVVKLNVADILAMKGVMGTDSRITGAIEDMEEWLDRFDNVRSDVYAAAGSGDYPIDAPEWMSRSTEAIDKVLGVQGAVSVVSSEKAKDSAEKSYYEIIMAMMEICLILLLVPAMSLFVFRKVCCTGRPQGAVEQLSQVGGNVTCH